MFSVFFNSFHFFLLHEDFCFTFSSLNFVSFCFILFYFFCYFQLMDWLFNHLSKGKIGNKGGCGAGRNSISDLNLFGNTLTSYLKSWVECQTFTFSVREFKKGHFLFFLVNFFPFKLLSLESR